LFIASFFQTMSTSKTKKLEGVLYQYQSVRLPK
jgi:hypothetical protein